jgi:WD40 repeat protein
MSVVRSCLLLVLIVSACPPAAAFPPLPVLDRNGEPLPAGAVGRLGTSQLRTACDRLHFSADGKTLIGTDADRQVRTSDAQTGKFLGSRPLLGPAQQAWVRSRDGRTLLVSRGKWIDLVEVETGRSIDAKRPMLHGFARRMAVSDDRHWLLFPDVKGERPPRLRGGFAMDEPVEHLILWDTTTGTGRTLTEDESGIIALEFSPDGKRAATSGSVHDAHTRVWDSATGQKLWEVSGYNAEEYHFTPDGKYLIAAPGGGQHDWHVWDAATGKRAAGFKPPTVGYAWMFAVSPEGTKLLIPTETDYVIWDLKSGEVLHRWPGANQRGRGTFAPDGRSVVTYDTILCRWDLATGKNLYADVEALGHIAPVRRVFLKPDGKRLVSISDDQTARVWDVPATKLIRTIPIDKPMDAWALTPNSSTLVGIDERMTVHRWSVDDGAKKTVDLRDAQKLDIGLRARDAQILADGTLAVVGWPRSPEYRLLPFSFSFWDLATGRLIRWGGEPGKEFRGEYCRLSPDGRLAAGREAAFDTRTGAMRGVPASPFGPGGMPVFSSDGRLLAAASPRDLRAWELVTGRVITDLPINSLEPAAFSSDGRRLAAMNGDRIAVWDLALRKQIAEGQAPARIGTVAFSPDGRMVATGHSDGTILLWRVPAPILDGPWSAGEASSAWDALADDLPANAYPALWQLADYPAETVRFLRAKAALAPRAGADEIDKAIAGLDNTRFAEREAATKRLRELGRAAEGPLRQALKRGPSAEQSARIETLLAGLEPVARPRGEDLRSIRAVAVLEYIGTDDARRLLAEWADRGSPPRLADEASRALERLRARE